MLEGKSVLITGASGGIGMACARRALNDGARVMLVARTPAALADAESALAGEFGRERVASVAADVGNRADVDRAMIAMDRFGAIDAVIHAAAVLPPIGSVLEVEPEEWLANIRTNLFGAFYVTRSAALRMKGRGGRIVLLSGGGASAPFPNYTAYASGKIAVVRFVETVAHELHDTGIEINALAPGFVITRMHEHTLAAGDAAGKDYIERTRSEMESGGVSPEVPAACACFLISAAANGITGRLVSAVHDDWRSWPDHLAEIQESDLFTLRRILPSDRGFSWH